MTKTASAGANQTGLCSPLTRDFNSFALNHHYGPLEMSNSKILVVDDSRTIRNAVKRTLVTTGYDVVCASNGHEAIDLLTDDFDLMILDINMPGLDGFEVCEQLKSSDVNVQNLPIIFLTSDDSRALELLGQQFGAYLQKPVSAEVLVSAVKEQLASDSVATN